MARGWQIDIEGITETAHGLGVFAEGIEEAVHRSLKGEGGEAILSEMRMGMRGSVRTGRTLASLKIDDYFARSVRIGAVHDGSYIGKFIESGVAPHEINPGAQRENKRQRKSERRGGLAGETNRGLRIGSRWVSHVEHPGFRGKWVAKRSLRTAKWEVEAATIDELHKLAARAGASSA